ncbi:MAG: ATP-binding cassette domain-containing protein [Thermoplasmata archaeon]|jgi:ABC-2 type transport system ATP-binding protein|nr:ATP-binding cassette domain-containing protein [Thermoplasmata archaeon]
MEPAVETESLTRVFNPKKKKEGKSVTALNSVDLRIERGELFGLLGPNGAGKTTLLKILSTLLLPTSGKAYVAGFDVAKDFQEVRKRINMVSGGEISGYGLLTVRENLWMFTQFYGMKSAVAFKQIDTMLELFGMSDKKNEKVRTLSTGMRQKMNVIRGFVTDPEILFLDEPTLGLDVNASRVIRDYIVEWVEKRPDKTVLLTTHYMAEADQLCDRIAIIDDGKILACDAPDTLKKLVKTSTMLKIDVTLLNNKSVLDKIPGVEKFTYTDDPASNLTSLKFVLQDESAVSDIVSEIVHSGAKILALRKTEPTLEDVFIKMVGKGFE